MSKWITYNSAQHSLEPVDRLQHALDNNAGLMTTKTGQRIKVLSITRDVIGRYAKDNMGRQVKTSSVIEYRVNFERL